eukprot:398540-Ditylum_brightwellii.AAC.1
MAIRNPVTNKNTQTNPEILEYLSGMYSDVSPVQLQQLRQSMENMTFDPSEPVDTIFTQINGPTDLATLARAPITKPQKIHYVYLTLQGAEKFNSSLTSWNAKAPADHTWLNCQVHFRDAQRALKKTGALTIQDSMNQTEMVSLVAEGIEKVLNMNDTHKMEQQHTAQQSEVSALQQQLAEMHTLIQNMQQGQESIPHLAMSAVAQPSMMLPNNMPFQQW